MPLGFFDPADPLGLKKLNGAGTATAAPLSYGPAPGTGSGPVAPRPLTYDSPTAPVTGIGQSIYNATSELQRRKKALVALSDPSSPYNTASRSASMASLALSDPSSPLYAASTGAKRGLFAAQGAQTAQQRGYYDTAGQYIAERQGENQALTAATHDTADLEAVAKAQGQRNAVNRLRDQVGIARPLEIDTLQNDTTPLPVGVARSLRTNATYISEANKEKDAVRGLELEKQRNAIDITGTNIADMRRAGDEADLNLSEARAGAGYRSKLSGLELSNAVDEAQYARDMTELELQNLQRAPFGTVPYEDPNTGEITFVSKAKKDELDYQYRNRLTLSRLPTEYAQDQARTQYGNQQESGGSTLAAYNEAQLLNTIPVGDAGLYTQPVIEELTRRYVLKGFSPQQARDRAVAQVQQELATRKKTGITVFGGAGSSPAAPAAPSAPTGTPFTFGP
jgi:hypothetical protein